MHDLAGKPFELIENKDGHAAGSTLMTFGTESDPFQVTYIGPNVKFGHAIVSNDEMIYHALDSNRVLSSGYAKVSFEQSNSELMMVLNWQWLTGDKSNGVSNWLSV